MLIHGLYSRNKESHEAGMSGSCKEGDGFSPKQPGSTIHSHTALRGIAALSVFLGHVGGQARSGMLRDWGIDVRIFTFFSWGNHAVLLFFILSGFILNWVYIRDGRPVYWRGYLTARIARVVPLYYLTLIPFLTPLSFYSLWGHPPDILTGSTLKTLLANFTMVSGIVFGWRRTLNSPSWSIGIEFFCYLIVFPLLVILARFLSGKKFGIPGSLLLVALLTYWLVTYRVAPIPFGTWHWDSHYLARGILGFLDGFFLCTLFRSLGSWRPRAYLIDSVLLGSLVVFVMARIGSVPAWYLLYTFPGVVLLLAYDQGWFARILRCSGFLWLGDRSYSIYLWHISLIGWSAAVIDALQRRFPHLHDRYGIINLLILTFVVLAFSDLSYRYFEIPCRDFVRRCLGGPKMHSVSEPKHFSACAPTCETK